MTDLSQIYPTMQLRDKARALIGIALSSAVFLTVGWSILAPFDPFGTIALLAETNPLQTVAAVLPLAVAVGVVCCAIAGSKLPDFGLFAIGLGLAVVNLKGGAMEQLLVAKGGSAPADRGTLCFHLIAEAWIWMIIVVLAGALAGWGVARFRGKPAPQDAPLPTDPVSCALDDVIELFLAGKIRWGTIHQEIRNGLSSMAASVVIACIIILLAMSQATTDAIQKGQVYFAIAAAFGLGSVAGFQLFRPAWCLWSYLAVPVVASIGYGLASYRPTISGLPRTLLSATADYNQLPMMPPNNFARGTPLDYISVGLAAAVVGCWLCRNTHRLRTEQNQ